MPTETVVDDRGSSIIRDWKTISISRVVEFIDLNEKDRPKRRKA